MLEGFAFFPKRVKGKGDIVPKGAINVASERRHVAPELVGLQEFR